MQAEQTWEGDLFAILDEARGYGGAGRLRRVIEGLQRLDSIPPLERVPEIADQIAKFLGDNSGTGLVPPSVLQFVEEYLKERDIESVLDPSAGFGSLVAASQRVTGATRVVACEVTGESAQIGSLLNPSAEWQQGNFLSLEPTLQRRFDLIVSVLPFGYRSTYSHPVYATWDHISRDIGFQILVQSSSLLSGAGIGIFVTTNSFLWARESPIHRLDEWGLGVEAALALPAGAFEPYTSIPTSLVVIRRAECPDMFVGQLSSSKTAVEALVTNLKTCTEGETVEQGRIVEPREFVSLGALRIDEQLTEAEREFGFPAMNLVDLMVRSIRGKKDKDFEFSEDGNSIFIPTVGNSDVGNSPQELTLKRQNYMQVEIDPAKSDARFVARFLNTELGRSIRESSKRGSTIKHYTNDSLKSMRVLVPPLGLQERVLEAEDAILVEQQRLLGLQNELADFQRSLWRNPRQFRQIQEEVGRFSGRMAAVLDEEALGGLDRWMETLPYPLAAILRAWYATSENNPKVRNEHLFDFFEGTSQFLSLILLSAYISRPHIYEAYRADVLKAANGKITRADFGTWNNIFSTLSLRTRVLLDENPGLCAELFADPSNKLTQMLASKKVFHVLDSVRDRRNDWEGHPGSPSDAESGLWHQVLLGHLHEFRDAMADGWSNVELVQPLACNVHRGVCTNQVFLLKGSNQAFETRERALRECLDSSCLHLIGVGTSQTLPLLPLIRLDQDQSPASTVCYFYSKVVEEGHRMVAYQRNNESEIKRDFPEITEAIQLIAEGTIGIGPRQGTER